MKHVHEDRERIDEGLESERRGTKRQSIIETTYPDTANRRRADKMNVNRWDMHPWDRGTKVQGDDAERVNVDAIVRMTISMDRQL